MSEQERLEGQQPENGQATDSPLPEQPAVLEDRVAEPAGEPSALEDAAAELPEGEEAAQEEDGLEKEMSLRYRIELEDYFQFNKITGAPVIAKNKKKFSIIGGFEMVFGGGFLLYVLAMGSKLAQQHNIGLSILLALLMLAMGAYSFFFYRLFYEGALRRTLKRQCAKTPYLQNEIVIDLYPNKFVEYNEGKSYETYWRNILEVRESDTLFMVMLTPTRCLLVPKNSIPNDVEAFGGFLEKICTNFEKRKVRI